MRPWWWLTTLALVSVAAGGVALPIAAQPTAADRFGGAQALFDAKNYAEALPLFQSLVTETGSPNARLYVARCLRELGRTPEAYDEMRETVRDATAKAQTEPKYNGTRDAAAAELALLDPKVAHVVLALTESSGAPGITLNGVTVPEAKHGSPITVMPGRQRIEIARPDRPVETREVEIAAGQTKTVAIGAVAVADPVKPPPPPASEGGELRWIGIGVAVLGVGAFGAFAGTTVAANAKFDEVSAACGGVRCTDPAFADEIDQGKALDAASTAMVVIGSVLVAGSIPMIILGGPHEAEPKPGAAPAVQALTVDFGPGFGRLGVTGSF